MYSDYFSAFNNESFIHEYGANKEIEIDLIMQQVKESNSFYKNDIFNIDYLNIVL